MLRRARPPSRGTASRRPLARRRGGADDAAGAVARRAGDWFAVTEREPFSRYLDLMAAVGFQPSSVRGQNFLARSDPASVARSRGRCRPAGHGGRDRSRARLLDARTRAHRRPCGWHRTRASVARDRDPETPATCRTSPATCSMPVRPGTQPGAGDRWTHWTPRRPPAAPDSSSPICPTISGPLLAAFTALPTLPERAAARAEGDGRACRCSGPGSRTMAASRCWCRRCSKPACCATCRPTGVPATAEGGVFSAAARAATRCPATTGDRRSPCGVRQVRSSAVPATPEGVAHDFGEGAGQCCRRLLASCLPVTKCGGPKNWNRCHRGSLGGRLLRWGTALIVMAHERPIRAN